MATSAYMSRSNHPKTAVSEKDMARLKNTQNAGHENTPPELQPKGNATPAPTPAPVHSTGEMALLKESSWGRSGNLLAPGKNPPSGMGYFGPSSLPPGVKADAGTVDPLGPAGADPVLRNIQTAGVAKAVDENDDWATRKVDSAGIQTTHGAVRQQNPDAVFGKKVLPQTEADNPYRHAADPATNTYKK